MRLALSLLLMLALLPVAGAQTLQMPVQLHDAGSTGYGLHIVPETVNAKPGQAVEFDVLNQGTSKHDFVFCGDAGQDAKAPPSSCHLRLGASPLLDPQGTATVSVTAPTAGGVYWYFCDLPGHAGGGMAGTLKVQAAATQTNKSPAPSALLVGVGLVGVALLLRRR